MMAERKRRQRNPAADLADDLIIEILVRLPARPLCRCKCVSRSWRDLISGPVHRRRLAHTDAASGFFYHAYGSVRAPANDLNFAALSRSGNGGGGSSPPPFFVDQAFPFVPWTARDQMELVDSCNGLLLLRSGHHASRYTVCNPTTQGWAVELPRPSPLPLPKPSREPAPNILQPILELDSRIQWYDYACEEQQFRPHWIESPRPGAAALAFDPAVSPYFHVFELVEEYGHVVKAVRIYSSETGEWVLMDSAWSYGIAYSGENAHLSGTEWRYRLAYAGRHAFLDGFLHLVTNDAKTGAVVVASVDTRGRTWRATRVSPAAAPVLAAGAVIGHSQRRLLYVDAGGYGRDRELSVYALDNRGGGERWILKHRAGSLDCNGCNVIAIHPDCNVIFLYDSRKRSLIAYDMDDGTTRNYHFFPYVPLYLQQELSV